MAKRKSKSARDIEAFEEYFYSKMKGNATFEEVLEAFDDLLEAYFLNDDFDKIVSLVDTYVEYASSHLNENTENFVYLLCLFCFTFFLTNKMEHYNKYLERAKKIATKLGEPKKAIDTLIDIFASKGFTPPGVDKEESIEHLIRKVEAYKNRDKVCDVNYIALIEQLVFEYIMGGDPDAAIALLEITIDEAVAFKPNVDSAILMRLYRDISYCYDNIDELECAVEYKRLEHEELKKTIDLESEEYKDFFLDYIALLISAEYFDSAVEEGEEKLSDNIKKNGLADSFSSELRSSIAMAKFISGNLDEALALAKTNYDINVQSYGEDSSFAVDAEKDYASFVFFNMDYKNAIKLFKDIKKKAKEYYDQYSDYLLFVREKLAESYIAIKAGKQAFTEARILAKYREQNEGNSENSLYAHYLMGCALRECGTYEDALAKLDDTYNKQVELSGNTEDEYAINTLFAIATVYEAKGEKERAKDHYSQVLESALRVLGPDSQLSIDSADRLERL